VQIVINTSANQYNLFDITTGELVVEGVADTLQGLKRNAKSAALSIGANFTSEVRNVKGQERKLVV
jgi:hypothetical protein